MLLLAEKSATLVENIIQFFNERKLPFFGGLFPGLVYAGERLEHGAVLKKFKAQPPFVVRNISTKRLNGLEALQSSGRVAKKNTFVLFVDGLTTNINHFLDVLNNRIGDRVSFLGGGAGSLSLQQQPCVFSNDGFFQDAAVGCFLERETRLGVRHGWEKLAGPFVATATEGNSILQLNWENAFDLYKRAVEQDAGVKIGPDNFFEISRGYAFGMYREDEEDILRDPISVNDEGHLTCLGEIPSNTVLNILKGDPASLISAAGLTVSDCKNGYDDGGLSGDTLIVECISRKIFLEDKFLDELSTIRSLLNINSEEQEPFGILSLGEISSFGEGLLEFFNKTVVVGILQDHPSHSIYEHKNSTRHIAAL